MCGSLGVDDSLNSGGACSATDFVGWSDFPKGLRVLLLDHDDTSAAEIRSKLEQMDYSVSLFSSENEALEAISSRTENFHVALVEVNTSSSQESYRFLETARGLPTLMVSNGNCLSTMMKCIALGAAEILQKPLSEDKLKNIWQHAVHKAFNAGESTLCRSLEPIRETVVTMLQLQRENANSENANGRPEDGTTVQEVPEKEHEKPSTHDRLPAAPSTPQLEQGIRSSSNTGVSHDHPSSNSSHLEQQCDVTCKDTDDFASSCKSADNTCNGDDPREEDMPTVPEVDSFSDSKLDPKESATNEGVSVRKDSNPHHGRKKMKVDWTPELHRRFIQAVEQLGIDQAIPSKILAIMKVEGLTRHNIASHLQKYRTHRKHALPKVEEGRWLQRRDNLSRKPLMAMPPPRSNLAYPSMYPAWGHPQIRSSAIPMWGHPWHSTQGSWPWKSCTRMYADAWGCPVFSQQDHYSTPQVHQRFSQNHGMNLFPNPNGGFRSSQDLQQEEEVIDEVVKEAISKPWLPLPIGLKPPSTDSVLAELQRQGIYSFPPTHSCK